MIKIALFLASLALLPTSVVARDTTKCSSQHLEECDVVTYVCRDRRRGTQFFTGASKRGADEWIALKKAQDAGYDINDCDKVSKSFGDNE